MFSKVVLALALAAGASASLFSADGVAQKYMWENFKAEHGKTYATMEEEMERFEVFLANLKVIDERNAADTATHGITKFADLTPEEFKTRYTNYKPDPARLANRTMDTTIEPLPEGADALVDWTGTYTTPVKDQGYCGSCWAFSATEQVESDYMRLTGGEQILSAQQVTSCTKYIFGGGCNGGFTENAFDYMKAGVETDSDYPYTSGKAGVTGSCNADSSKFVVKATGYTTVSSSPAGESSMASYVGKTGPLSVCVDAETWSSYTGGIMSKCGTSVDHCVQAVGIDTAAGYWKVRNSWGTSWGESGFIRLSYGSNTCAIASDANYAGATDY
jgi:C1A family cysteine protease